MNVILVMSDLCLDLLCTSTLVFTCFCNCKLSIKKLVNVVFQIK
jgi:hypothetical protein